MRRGRFAGVSLGLLLTACAPVDATAERIAPITSAVGEPQSCLPADGARREPRYPDDWTIDVVFEDGRIFRNILNQRCPGMQAAGRIIGREAPCEGRLFWVGSQPENTGPICRLGNWVQVRYAGQAGSAVAAP